MTETEQILTGVIEKQSEQIAEMSQRIKELTAQLAYFQRRMFGRSSEKNLNLDSQPNLFEAAGVAIPGDETLQVITNEATDKDIPADERPKKSRKGARKS